MDVSHTYSMTVAEGLTREGVFSPSLSAVTY